MNPRDRYRTWGGRHGKRLPHSQYSPGYAVHVIVCTFGRESLFLDRRLAGSVFGLVDGFSTTHAACLMPDHLHWLLSGETDFSREVQRFKSYTTRVAWSLGRNGRLWQRSFYDHVVRRRVGIVAVTDYILENPIRAGLVADWRDYPYSCNHLEEA